MAYVQSSISERPPSENDGGEDVARGRLRGSFAPQAPQAAQDA